MSETPKRVDVRVRDFAFSIQGFDDPVDLVSRLMTVLQTAIDNAPDRDGSGLLFDEDLQAKLSDSMPVVDGNSPELVPGLIVMHPGLNTSRHDTPSLPPVIIPAEDEISEATGADATPEPGGATAIETPAADAAVSYGTEDAESLPVFADTELRHAEHDPLASGVGEALDAAAEALDEAGVEIEIAEDLEGNKTLTFPSASDPHSVRSSQRDDLATAPVDDAQPPGLASDDPYIRELAERIERINSSAAEAEAEGSASAPPSGGSDLPEFQRDEATEESGSSIFATPADDDPHQELGSILAAALGETSPAASEPDDDVLILSASTQQPDETPDDSPDLRSRLDAMVERVAGSEIEMDDSVDDDLDGDLDDDVDNEPGDTPLEDFVGSTGSSSINELMLATAGWLQMVQARDGFSRGEVLALVDRLPGSHDRSIEAKIRAYSELLRNGGLVARSDGMFEMSETATTGLINQINQSL